MKLLLTHIALVLALGALAQSPHDERPEMSHSDTSHVHNVKEFFSRGKVSGHIRYYFMSTVNPGELSDYYANAAGGVLKYHTHRWMGFQLGIGGNFIYNLGSSDLLERDELSHRVARFERQLFDVTDPENRYDMDRLEELYVDWKYRDLHLVLGKQEFYTPLVNPQDGRMKPYVVDGLWINYTPGQSWLINGGWIRKVSPRSTVSWYRVEDAIGLYNQGLNPDGTLSDYRGNLGSKGMGIFGIQRIKGDWSLQFWDYYLDNILNAAFVQLDYTPDQWVSGIQYLREDPLGVGGTELEHQAYYPSDQNTNLFSFRFGRKLHSWTLTANYTTILESGRFLFPREFGREQFYTTIGRGRMDGMGGAQTLMFKAFWIPKQHPAFSLELDAGRTWTPGHQRVALNKYIADSYDQYNVDVRYQLAGIWQGLVVRFLYGHNRLLKGGYTDPSLIHNRHNYHHFNLITNIYF